MSRLAGAVALVTGASKGIGAGIARRLAADGAAVAVNYAADRAGADAVVQAISDANGRAVAIQGDVTSARQVAGVLEETHAAFGRLDILVNNAGVYRAMPLVDFSENEFHRQFNTNVLGPLLVTREALRYFGTNGCVINIGSGASQMHPPDYSVYAATKSALDMVTRVLAKELAGRGIRVNSVNPGATLSEGTEAAGLYGRGGEFERQLVAMTPLGRLGTPTDIAQIVAFLASADSGWLTGEVILASGGLR